MIVALGTADRSTSDCASACRLAHPCPELAFGMRTCQDRGESG
jgi:hypothetical protein